jgi:hypothetical protein
MQRGDIVNYLFPGLVDVADPDTVVRARGSILSRLAVVISATATEADIVVLDAETWESPRIVRGVEITLVDPETPNRNQVDDRDAAIQAGTLDAIRTNVKGWVKAL